MFNQRSTFIEKPLDEPVIISSESQVVADVNLGGADTEIQNDTKIKA